MKNVEKLFDELILNINDIDTSRLNDEYYCLSVRQPWADLIINGIKKIENRTWVTDYRGLLLIHAPLTFNFDDYNTLELSYYRKYLKDIKDYELGYIIGSVDLVDINMNEKSYFAKKNNYHWMLENSFRFRDPIKYKGKLSIFKIDNNYKSMIENNILEVSSHNQVLELVATQSV